MKKYLKLTLALVLVVAIQACQEDDQVFGDIIAPTNVQIQVDIEGADADNPNGDGSGVVTFRASADNALGFQFTYNGVSSAADQGEITYNFSNLGLNTYTVTAVAFGTGGASTSRTIEVDVLSTYEPPADLITMLTSDSSRSWRIKSEAQGHFGLGAIGGDLNGFFSAPPFDKEGVGMYDDRYVFNIDGTFTHITNNTNDEDGTNTDGTVFGRENLINELGGPGGGTANGADIENYPYSDYEQQWFITAPGGAETLNLTDIGFLGYYVGGNHTYIMESRSLNEMVLRTTDGNGEFDWGFILIADD